LKAFNQIGGLDRYCWGLIAGLLIFEVFLGIMHVAMTWPTDADYIYYTRRMFNLNREGNLPTWFSSMQFFLLGIVLISSYFLDRQLRPSKRSVIIWIVCAAGAIFLSADEAARFHEWSGTLLGGAIDNSEKGSLIHFLGEFPSYYWPIVYLPVALPASIIVGIFLWKELGNLRYLSIAGIVVFFVGAVVLDFLEGAYGTDDHGHWRVTIWRFDQIMDTHLIEEMMEMFGVTLVLAACLLHASRLASQLNNRSE